MKNFYKSFINIIFSSVCIKNSTRFILFILLLNATINTANAQYVKYIFGTANYDTITPSCPKINPSAVSQGNNNGTTTLITSTSTSNNAGASGGGNAGAAARTGALNTAANGSAYFEFTITPNNHYQVSLTGISFNSRSTSTGPANFAIRSSLDGYASNLSTGSLTANSTWSAKSASFSATSGGYTPITFRIYGYGGTGSAAVNTANWRIDDLNINYSTACFGTTISACNKSLTCYGTSILDTIDLCNLSMPYTISLNGVPMGTSNVFLTPVGTYTVVATDIDGPVSTVFTITQPTQVVATPSFAPIKCNGGTTAIHVLGTGGTGTGLTYQYAFNGGANTLVDSFTNNVAGTYTVSAIDTKGCIGTATVVLNEPTALTLSQSHGIIKCFNGGTTIKALPSGGTAPYKFKINNSAIQSIDSFTNIVAGNYTVYVTDNNGCTANTTFTLTQPNDLVVSVTGHNASCYSTNDAIAVATVSGGKSPYTFSWFDNSLNALTNTTFLNNNYGIKDTVYNLLAPSCYNVLVSDTNGCQSVANPIVNFCVAQPTLMVLNTSASAILCNSGTSTISNTGDGVSFTLNGGASQTSGVFLGNLAGTYTVVATNATGCTRSNTLTITQPTAVTLTASPSTILCNGGNSTITLTQSGGTGSFADTTNGVLFTNPYLAGSYTISATDANGCSKTTAVSISQPTAVNLSASASTILCNGGTSTITLTQSGGTGSFADTTNGAVFTNPYLAGSYTISATDANGCSKTTTVSISQPTAVTLSASASSILCNGGNSTITLTQSGGTGSFADTTNGAVFNNPYLAGSYTISTTDANGCSKTTTLSISEPTAVTLSASASSILCNGGNSTITLTQSGGTGTFADTTNGAVFTNPYLAGSYTISATDANGCSKTTTVSISQPTAVTLSASASSILCNGGNSTITLTQSGGTGSFADTTNGAVFNNPYLAGSYTTSATDANGCNKTTTLSISEPSAVTLSASASSILCNGGNSTITLTQSGGTGLFKDSANGAVFTNSYPAGSYTLSATDANGCSKTTTVSISQPTAVTLSANPSSILCNGGTSTITLTQSGGTGSFADTTNGAVFTNPYLAGSYTISATDANGCSKTTSLSISQPTAVSLSASPSSILCNGGNSTITLTQSGGTGTLADTTNGAVFNNPYLAGSYTISATDANGCSKTTSLSISQPTAVSLSASPSSILCNGGNSTITLTQSGGTGSFADTTNGAVFTNPYLAGSYTISATDANGCSKTTAVTLTDPAAIAISANATSTSICKTTTTLLTATGTGLTYTWMPGAATGANDTIMPTATTIYTVTGTDGVCSNTATVQVVVNTTSGDLSQATGTNMLSTAGSSCTTSLQPDGSTVSYFDNNCDLIATVQDISPTSTLGSVTSCVTVDPTVQNVNGQPYLPRHYTITPTTSGPANVTLYYTQDDLNDYNANNGSLPDLPTTGGGTVSMCIYQYTKMLNAPGSTFEAMIPVTLTWDAVGHHWTVTFPVTGFSEFYCAACNPTASPLSVDVVDFAGRKDGNTSLLTWTTLHETNNANFVVKRGTSTLDINTTLGTVKTLAANGTSSSPLNYSYVDEKPNNGHNYYQLQQVDIDGKVNTVNKIVDVYYTDGATVTVYPNPTQDDLHVDINIDRATQATIKIMDVAGKTIKTIETDLTKGINKTNVKLSELVPGTYLLKVIDGKGLNYSQQFRKM